MMGFVTAATLPLSITYRHTTNKKKRIRKPRTTSVVVCNFGDVVRKDMEFLKKGVNWASQTLHIPKLSKAVNDFIWLRHLEDSTASFQPRISWPHPFYPGLTGMDLFMADLKALEAYGYYIHYLSKTWSKPLPEVYVPQEVEDYFSCRPHLVTLRLLEVFLSFALAAIKLRTSAVFRFWNSGVDKNMDDQEYFFGNMLKETFLNLGPTFIKVGQSLSTRPDIIGSEISKALSELHDGVPPFPRSVAMQIIEEELGSPIESVFSYISDEPVAAASFGQVYRGITIDGHNVAIKVQRPNLRHVVVRDIYLLRLGLGLVQKVARRKNDLRVYADELGKGLVGELDYTLEAANASEFREAHSPFPFIFVPRVYGHLSKRRVLTMEWLVGEHPKELLLVSSRKLVDRSSVYSGRQPLDAKKRLLDLVTKGVEASLTQLLETGLLHADPHPGNLRYTATGQIGFLDFGLICRMEMKHQFAMLSSIVHIVNGDWAGLVHDLTEMDVAKSGTSIHRLTLDLEDALGEVETKDGIPDIKFSRVLAKIWSVALKYHFRMPPYYMLVFRSLASLEGLAVAADQDFKTFDAAFPYVVRKLLTDNSAASRKILHSVVFNKRKEIQWQKLSLFLRMGVNIKGVQRFIASNFETSHENAPTVDSSKVANLVVRLLPSKDGMVLRRVLMTADEASLVQVMVSREAIVFRKQVTIALADVLYQWMSQALGQSNDTSHLKSGVKMVSGLHHKDESPSSGISASVYDYHSVIKDRRLQLICRKVLDSARRQPLLMLKFSWASIVMFLSAFVFAFHKILVTWSDKCIASLSFAPRMIAFSS